MRTAWRILGTRLCIRYALWASQTAGFEEFICRFDCFASPKTGCGLDPRLLHAWDAGKRYISGGLVHRIDSQVAGTKIVYTIATLLQQQGLSAPAVRRVVKPIYAQIEGTRLWKLPCLDVPGAADVVTASYGWADLPSLVSRGDFLGFLAILALLRESVAIRDLDCVRRYARGIYAILPSVCRICWVRRDVDLLLQCIEDMMIGIRWFLASTTIDWGVFREQISNPRPWAGVAPWIVGHASDLDIGSSLPRPVPLLQDAVPLQPYVRLPAPERRRSSADGGPHLGQGRSKDHCVQGSPW
jgi:hypothetical protein